MLHMRMKWVDEVSVGISLCFHLLVLLISSMLNTPVPFLLKTGKKSASEKNHSHNMELAIACKRHIWRFPFFLSLVFNFVSVF